MKNVIIVEDVKTIREGLKSLIEESHNLQCTETFENFENFQKQISKLNPDIILIDLNLPGISGIEGIKRLKKISKKVIIIVLTVHEENESIFEALSAGASNYLVKNTPSKKMISIIEDAIVGKVLMNSFIARKTIDYMKKKNTVNILNKKEISILKKVTEGNNLIAIENSLKICSNEIKNSFKDIYDKLCEVQ